MKFVVVDLEMCKVPKRNRCKEYRYSSEIIEIGAVMMDESYELIDMFDTYVSPAYGEIDLFIEDLTGIKKENLIGAPSLQEALDRFAVWCGPKEEITFFAWSGSDLKQISHEVMAKELASQFNPYLDEECWIDYQDVFGKRFSFDHSVSLENALDLSAINPEGNMHCGLDDAYNTARMIQKLETNPDYELPAYWKEAKRKQTDTLSFSLGDLFAGLNLVGLSVANA